MNFLFIYLILLKSAMHRHGHGVRLGACLLYTPCVVAFVACVNADEFSVYVPDFVTFGCAWAWTRHAPQYMPSARAVCRVSVVCSICECFNIQIVRRHGSSHVSCVVSLQWCVNVSMW